MTETLMAVGTLAIGLTFVGGTFLTGIYFSSLSTERSIAAVAAEEAFAKIRIYGLDPNHASLQTGGGSTPYEQLVTIPAEEYLYPTTSADPARQYSWAALCRRADSGGRLVQCTVFVSRQTPSTRYWFRRSGADWPQLGISDANLPRPLRINLVQDPAGADASEVLLKDAVPSDPNDESALVMDGALLVDDGTGQIYRVLERSTRQPDRIRLDRPWGAAGASADGWAWVVPPAVSGGRNPLIAVYQQVLRFPGN
ncbi:MAG: hypothetical protein MUC88_17800 [Planctomycetes bacterium]|nr:hypothetical protein [Planctomycetota bacterium]